MAVSESFFGLRRKSTKSHTYQVDGFGQQVTKDRVQEVHNPRTPAQMRQRMIIATVSAAYNNMKEIVNHSWEGLKYGAVTQAEFSKVNQRLLKESLNDYRPSYGFNAYRDRILKIGRWQISNGTLTSIPCSTDYRYNAPFRIDIISAGGITKYVFYFVDNGTWPNFCNNYDINVGDTLTLCLIGKTVSGFKFAWVRLIVNSTTDNLSSTPIPFEIEANTRYSLNIANNERFGINLVDDDWRNSTYSSSGVLISECSFGCIHSRYSDGIWLRSKCIMDCRWQNYYDIPETYYNALASYPTGPGYVLDGGGR